MNNMTLQEILALVSAGYTKADIDALTAPVAPSVPQTPAAPAQAAPAAPSVPQTPAAPAQVAPAAPSVPQTPAAPAQAAPTMADVMQAITNLSARITPAPTFQQTPAPRGVDDIIHGFLGDGVKGGVNNG